MEVQKVAQRYAIFQRGLKQYQAIEGKTLALDNLEGKPGETIEFKEVLFKKTGDENFEIGKPFLNSSVKATVIKHTQGQKVVAMRFKRRKKVMTVKNSRPQLTVVRIESI